MRRPLLAVGLALVLALPSLGTVQKYLGTGAVWGYLVAALALVPVVIRFGLPVFLRVTTERSALWLAAATFVALAVAFAIVYPHVNSGATTSGSDRDEDADIATRRLLHLRYPYYAVTYLGNHLTHMPGSLLLAIPFVLVWTSALQNLFWLPAFFLALRGLAGDARVALLALWLLLAGSPAVLRELLTGGDLIANNLYVLVFALAVLAAARPGRPAWHGVLATAALGVALSSRANFLFVLPLLLAALARHHGLRRAVRDVAITVAAFVVVTLPFYLYDPSGFTPRRTSDKLGQFDGVLPHANAVVVSVAVLLCLAFALSRLDGRGERLFALSTVVQAVFVVAGVALASAQAGRADFGFLISGYGLNVAFFGLFAATGALARCARAADMIRP